MNRQKFAVSVLNRLGIPASKANVKALVGWQRAEGGHWNNTAEHNPLNTTQNMPGSGDTGTQGNISVYRDWDQGVAATVQTLKNGRYGPILNALKSGGPRDVAAAIDQSPWGTHGSLVYQTIAGAKVNPAVFARLKDQAPGKAPGPSYGSTPRPTPAAPGEVDPAVKKSLVTNYFQQSKQPDALINLAMGLKQAGVINPAVKDVPIVGATRKKGDSPITTPGSTPDTVRAMIERANKIDSKRYPYVWGGGHAKSGKPDGGTGRDPGTGFDCSGAVAAVLGVDPRHSSQFAAWGKAGRAKGGKGVTVYANGSHVLMEINGHFFGTSGSNPAGGAGWIPRKAVSKSYLSGFTARHL